MCNTLNIKALELYCNIKKWNIELDTLMVYKNLLGTVFLIVLSFCPKVPRVRPRLLYMFYTGRQPNDILLS